MFKIFSILAFAACLLYVAYQRDTTEKPHNVRKTNEINKIKYSFRLKHGMLTIMANKCVFNSVKKISLQNVHATYDAKKISIFAQNCLYLITSKKIILSGYIKITLNNAQITTTRAEIDIAKRIIYTNDKFAYNNKNFSFTGIGFRLTQDGNLTFKNAAISSK